MKNIIYLILMMGIFLQSYSKTYEYARKVNDRVVKSVWEVTEKNDMVILYCGTANLRETLKSERNSGTSSWLFENKLKQEFLKAEKYRKLNKNFIKISGRLNGKKIEKEYEIGDKLWIQNIFFEMKNFILSDKKELEFYLIRKSDGEIVSMKIEKKEVQEKIIFNKKVAVVKTEVKEDNIFSEFTKSDYWFRRKDGLCLAYSGYEEANQKNKVIIKLIRE